MHLGTDPPPSAVAVISLHQASSAAPLIDSPPHATLAVVIPQTAPVATDLSLVDPGLPDQHPVAVYLARLAPG